MAKKNSATCGIFLFSRIVSSLDLRSKSKRLQKMQCYFLARLLFFVVLFFVVFLFLVVVRFLVFFRAMRFTS